MTRSIKGIIGVVLIVIAASAVAAINALFATDRGTGDPTVVRAGESTRTTVVLLDATDPFAPDQIAALQSGMRVMEDRELLPGETVSVWVLSGPGQLRCVFRRRFPGRAVNRRNQNPAFVASECDSLFSRPLAKAIAQAGSVLSSPRTEIHAALRELWDLGEFRGPHVRLLLISDLGETHGQAHFAPLDLKGDSVEVVEVVRPNSTFEQRAARRSRWRNYFSQCGATVSFGRIS